LDLSRVHFLGNLEYTNFLALLQISRVHVYLTYPFVLSWSLLEAMSSGCAIVASDTAPLREAIHDGETGLLVDFFDPKMLAQRVSVLSADRSLRERLGTNARALAQKHFDLKQVCLPRMLALINRLGAK
jgi:glycosyltransferase involved in cell wall biosynthesis